MRPPNRLDEVLQVKVYVNRSLSLFSLFLSFHLRLATLHPGFAEIRNAIVLEVSPSNRLRDLSLEHFENIYRVTAQVYAITFSNRLINILYDVIGLIKMSTTQAFDAMPRI